MEALKKREEKVLDAGKFKDFSALSRNKQRENDLNLLRNITISTIIFGLSDMQVNGLKHIESSLAPIIGKSSTGISAALIGEDLNSFFHGRINEDEYISRAIRKNGWKVEIPVVRSIIHENFKELESIRELLIRLKKQGFKLGLLSIHPKEWIEYNSTKFDYHRFFDAILYSFEAELSKPNKKAYEIILEKLDSKPEECIFVDDNQANLNPARELGMKTVFFESASQIESEFRKIGLFKE